MREIDYLFETTMSRGPAHLDVEDWQAATLAWSRVKDRLTKAEFMRDEFGSALERLQGETGQMMGVSTTTSKVFDWVCKERDRLKAELEQCCSALATERSLLKTRTRERDHAREVMDFEKVEDAVQFLWRKIQCLHSDILRADGDMSRTRGRMQQPWFDLSQERKAHVQKARALFQEMIEHGRKSYFHQETIDRWIAENPWLVPKEED